MDRLNIKMNSKPMASEHNVGMLSTGLRH